MPTLIPEIVSLLLGKNPHGEWLSEPLKNQRFYVCYTASQIKESMSKAIVDLREEGFPWLMRFQGSKDVVKGYHLQHVHSDEPPDIPENIGDPTFWAIYGFMLRQLGDADKARRYLARAEQELAKDIFTDGSRFSSQPFSGSKPMPRSTAEVRLIGLLRQALGQD